MENLLFLGVPILKHIRVLYSLNAIYKTTYAFDTNKIRLATKTVIEILSISGFVLVLVMVDGGHLGKPNCKKIKIASCMNHCDLKLVQFH